MSGSIRRWVRYSAESLGQWLSWSQPRPLPRSPDERADLWDRWLDADAVIDAEPVDPFPFDQPPRLFPRRAPVRPRVIARDSATGAAFCLEDEVLAIAKTAAAPGAIGIIGPPGMGKTTALKHLAAVLPPALGVCILDEPDASTLNDRAESGVVVYATGRGPPAIGVKHLALYTLAPWGEDESIEYLLATGRSRPLRASVITRLRKAADRDWLGGSPELGRIVLYRLAGDPGLASAHDALRQELATRLSENALRRLAEELSLTRLIDPHAIEPATFGRLARRCRDGVLMRLLRHRPIQLLLAAQRVVSDLAAGERCDYLAAALPRDLVQEAGRLLHDNATACESLRLRLLAPRRSDHPTAASLLHAARTGWRPGRAHPPRLSGAYLERASWNGVDLSVTELVGTDLSGADLVRGRLSGANANNALFRGAFLRGASLQRTSAQGADLSEADLAAVSAFDVRLRHASLEGANLTGACLREAKLQSARLSRARLIGADLTRAELAGATLAGANFSGAVLDGAKLKGLALRHAEFANARFNGADLSDCDLEEMELPRACFREARLHRALLTGAKMPGADFRGASLRFAGLAEVDWEGACLAGADLRHATFHLGTTRSGLVQSPIACEGSRTGFYTDDFDAQDFQPPEEIRKANLRRADLRGANIDDVDFYLVDLRDARFDARQADHFRRCGAILGT